MRADRRTLAIPTQGALNVYAAVWFAREIGLPLNRHTTIHWERGGVSDALAATSHFLALASAWVRSRGAGFAYVWVRESGPNKGEHVHILLRVPPDLAEDFKRRQRGWLKACGAAWRKGVVHSERIGFSLRHADQAGYSGETYAANLGEVLDYILKGAGRVARKRLGLRRCEPGGLITGKRCGVSLNIGQQARRREFALGVSAEANAKSSRADSTTPETLHPPCFGLPRLPPERFLQLPGRR
jgi:hypothetical protein